MSWWMTSVATLCQQGRYFYQADNRRCSRTIATMNQSSQTFIEKV